MDMDMDMDMGQGRGARGRGGSAAPSPSSDRAWGREGIGGYVMGVSGGGGDGTWTGLVGPAVDARGVPMPMPMPMPMPICRGGNNGRRTLRSR